VTVCVISAAFKMYGMPKNLGAHRQWGNKKVAFLLSKWTM